MLDKDRIRSQTAVAIRAGKITRSPCERCGNEESEAHHEDYHKPSDIVWLCKNCHAARHKEIVKEIRNGRAEFWAARGITNGAGRPKKEGFIRRHVSLREETDERLREFADRQCREFSAQADLAINKGLDALEAEENG